MSCWAYWYVVLGDVDADAETLRIDVREVMLGLFWVLVSNVEANMIQTVNLHLLVDGTSHDVARGKVRRSSYFSMKLSPLGKRRMPP